MVMIHLLVGTDMVGPYDHVHGHHGHELLLMVGLNIVVLAVVLPHDFYYPNELELAQGVHQGVGEVLEPVIPAQVLLDLFDGGLHTAVTVHHKIFFITHVFFRIEIRKSFIIVIYQ